MGGGGKIHLLLLGVIVLLLFALVLGSTAVVVPLGTIDGVLLLVGGVLGGLPGPGLPPCPPFLMFTNFGFTSFLLLSTTMAVVVYI